MALIQVNAITLLFMRKMSAFGTKRTSHDVRYSVAIEGKADVHRAVVNRRE